MKTQANKRDLIQLSIKVGSDQDKWLRQQSYLSNRSVSDIIRAAIEIYRHQSVLLEYDFSDDSPNTVDK